MSLARLYADENFPHPVVEELRRQGHDVLTAQQAGQAGQRIPDEAVLAFAHAEGRAVLTINRKDFIQLHGRGAGHSGIVACTQDRDFAGQAVRIDAEIGEVVDLHGRLIRVNRPP